MAEDLGHILDVYERFRVYVLHGLGRDRELPGTQDAHEHGARFTGVRPGAVEDGDAAVQFLYQRLRNLGRGRLWAEVIKMMINFVDYDKCQIPD